jgi:hypothetical protein
MRNVQEKKAFHEHELVTWHYQRERYCMPIPAVVIRQERDSVVIRARIEGATRELHVDPEQLVTR